MSDTVHSALIIAVVAVITAALRFAPFIVFGSGKTPRIITYLANVLPYAIMAMLVIYCLRDISFIGYPYGLPELISVAAVIVLHIFLKKTLLSIGAGVALYMILIQLVFV